jgi:hypothetical protein
MPSAGFEPAIPASKRPQNYALDRAATGIGENQLYSLLILISAIKSGVAIITWHSYYFYMDQQTAVQNDGRI